MPRQRFDPTSTLDPELRGRLVERMRRANELYTDAENEAEVHRRKILQLEADLMVERARTEVLAERVEMPLPEPTEQMLKRNAELDRLVGELQTKAGDAEADRSAGVFAETRYRNLSHAHQRLRQVLDGTAPPNTTMMIRDDIGHPVVGVAVDEHGRVTKRMDMARPSDVDDTMTDIDHRIDGLHQRHADGDVG